MFKLRPYQKEAVDNTIKHFQRSKDPVIIVLPTGSGKSIVIAELARLAKGRVLVLAHVKELVEQNSQKLQTLDIEVGIYSAGLNAKSIHEKIIFGSIQSVSNAPAEFFKNFSLLVVDECHRIDTRGDTQYNLVINRLKENNPGICLLGLTATPYRLDQGWIYNFHKNGTCRTQESRFFKKCIYELGLSYLINQGFLTPAIQIESPVSGYDFSELQLSNGRFNLQEIEKTFLSQKKITPIIIKNIIELTKDYQRKGVMIFTSSIRHANEILDLMDDESVALVTGKTDHTERDKIISQFKERKIKYLINVSVLTTGFDAPHVDVIAILRPTESVGLYQQIIGRGLRLSEGKSDCLVLDYTGQKHDIFSPVIRNKKPHDNVEPVQVKCPLCSHINEFWGTTFPDGSIEEHFGRKCQGYHEDANQETIFCNFLFRYKLCPNCGEQNDIAASRCIVCSETLLDPEKALKEARSMTNAHVLKVEEMTFTKSVDKKFQTYLEIKYFDADANMLEERYYLNSPVNFKIFHYNFERLHGMLPQIQIKYSNIEDILNNTQSFKKPVFVIAKRPKKHWIISDKIFDY